MKPIINLKKAGLLATTVCAFALAMPFGAAHASHGWHDGHGKHRGNGHYRGRGHGHYDRGHSRHRGRSYSSTRIIINSGGPRYRTRYYDEPVYYHPAPAYPTGGTYSRLTCTDNNNVLPTVIGGAAGGIIGNTIGKGSGRTAAIITGTLIGGMVGNRYTQTDRYCTREVFETVDAGIPARWHGVNDDYYYTVTPTRNYETAGRYCREYQAVATIGNRVQETYGTACRQPDGSWQIIN